MKALILTAGQGSRLRPYTDHCPKGMVTVNGRTILDHQIEQFNSLGISEIAIVKGYKRESVQTPPDVVHYVNDDYASTNMAQTLMCAESFFDEQEVIVSYSDILYHRRILQALIDCRQCPAVVVDKEWMPYFADRFGNPYADAESLILDENQYILNIGKSKPHPDEVHAQYIGLMKFNKNTMQRFKQMFDEDADEKIGWGRVPLQSYMTDVLQELIYREHKIKAVVVGGGWLEIDTVKDYEIAKQSFQERIGLNA